MLPLFKLTVKITKIVDTQIIVSEQVIWDSATISRPSDAERHKHNSKILEEEHLLVTLLARSRAEILQSCSDFFLLVP